MNERLAELIVQECIQQLEIGKKCDPYTGELFTCEHNDNIDYQIKVLKEHFEIGFPEKFQTSMNLPVMRQALEALEDAASDLCSLEDYSTAFQEETITALRQAIAEAEKHVHAVNTSSERVNKTEKNEHEDWHGQWQWQCGYERGWDKAMERKREWVGLTDEEVGRLTVFDGLHHVEVPILADFAFAIEAKLKEKNNG